ncbi:flavodoxin-dependent (E)-4-hydroxy-3-methylbut-2-enyl-diphosphate synthase [Deferribacter autotrophicus]|uniref:flavodoxin-dependent (E)-4-hydroxy-3-methylbut-2-enyl-diphosphate synthase n=1 Tax=Deferribacter autotrophicus TaxID=500465 RepID=UPI00165DC7A3|nr:flavodoxin-dependent (E)-4-hydroxy-3-methylbut-2-enyl-diphosphate synthase [Deferribacter autotrophicus]
MRRVTKEITLGNLKIGGKNPITVQSMTNTDTRDVESTLAQIKRLEEVGCEIIRVAVVDEEAARCIKRIKDAIKIPLIADIHFDYRLAILSMENGADGIRINPGNIGSEDKVRKVIDAAKIHNVAIRIGVNSGSLEKEFREKYGVCARAMVESALKYMRFFEKERFYNMKFSLKGSDVMTTIEAYREFSKISDYPLHLGVTEAGTLFSGTMKSAVGIGTLLAEGIGDTIRVSLTADPVEEVKVGFEILKALGLRDRGAEIISCPTCGRCEIDLMDLASKVENELAKLDKKVTVAVMGCVVNGPGEAREADYGIAGGRGVGIIFKKGRVLKKVKEEELLEEFLKIIKEEIN